MTDIKFSGNKKVGTLCKEFKDAFGSTLRVYNGRSIADENDTLSAIRKEGTNGGELTVKGNILVGNFEKKVLEMYGIKVQVATADNTKLAADDITIAAAGREEDSIAPSKPQKEPQKDTATPTADSKTPGKAAELYKHYDDLSGDARNFLDTQKHLIAYDVQEYVLQNLVRKYPDHKLYEAVATKVKLLNLFYSTGILAVDAMAENIMSIKNIDELLHEKVAVPHLVEAISRLSLDKGERINYSFATKYCALHQPDKYPIFDSIVEAIFVKLMQDGNLPPYQYKTKKKEVSTDVYMTLEEFRLKLHDYASFIQIYDSFMQAYGLKGKLSYREVDWYLWGSFKEGGAKTRIEEIAPIPENKYREYK